MIQRQDKDCVGRGDDGAINGLDVETSGPATIQKGERPTADDRTDHAEQNIDNGALARGAGALACSQPEPRARIPTESIRSST